MRDPSVISGIFLNSAILGGLGTRQPPGEGSPGSRRVHDRVRHSLTLQVPTKEGTRAPRALYSRYQRTRRTTGQEDTAAFDVIRSSAWVLWLVNQVLSKIIDGKPFARQAWFE